MATKTTDELLAELITEMRDLKAKNQELEERVNSGALRPMATPSLPAEQDRKVPAKTYFARAAGFGFCCHWRGERNGVDPHGNIIKVAPQRDYELKFKDILDPETRLPDVLPRFRGVYTTTSENEQMALDQSIEQGDAFLFVSWDLAEECGFPMPERPEEPEEEEAAPPPPPPKKAAPAAKAPAPKASSAKKGVAPPKAAAKKKAESEAPVETTEAEEEADGADHPVVDS